MDKGKGKVEGAYEHDYSVASGSSGTGLTAADKGKGLWEDAAIAGKEIWEDDAVAGKEIWEDATVAGKGIWENEAVAGKGILENDAVAGKGIWEVDAVVAGKGIWEDAVVAGKGIWEDAAVAGEGIWEYDAVVGKEIWEDDAVAAALVDSSSFSGHRRDTSLLLGLMPPQLDDSRNETLVDHLDDPLNGDVGGETSYSIVQIQAPTPTIERKSYMDLRVSENHLQSSSRSVPSGFSQQVSQITVPNMHDDGDLPFMRSASSSVTDQPFVAEIMAVQKACIRACFDPEQGVARRLMHESPQALKRHYAPDVETFYRDPTNWPAPMHMGNFDFSQSQHPGSGGLNNKEFESLIHNIKYRENRPMRLIDIKGHVPAVSVDPYGSHFIQVKLDKATTGEILMVYKEVAPHVCVLAVDAFANYATQKLLGHGPPFCRKELVRNLLRHVFDLSFNLFGCRVIQKAFELSETDLQIGMAKELCRDLFKCVRDQYANHVIQKCIEFVPPQCIRFVYTNLCGKAKMLSSHPYGCRVVQKALEFCTDQQIMQALVSEIIECVIELSGHQFGNYVVQYVVERGGSKERQMIVLKLAGRIMQMSYQKHSSNVIEKCLLHGSYRDRKLIITEILFAGGGQTVDHLLRMMVDQYANYVVQKMIETADEWQLNVIVDVVRCNLGMLTGYIHGRHVVAQVERILSARAGFHVSLAASQSAPPRYFNH